jgi:DNA-binding response OmpR family regulator
MGKKILILEKDINISYSLQTQFLIVGMDVLLIPETEKDIELTMDKIIKYSPDYIIIDLFLRNIDSFSLIKEIKQCNLDVKLFTYTKLNKKLTKKCKENNIDYFFSSTDLSLNQFAIKTIKTINNLEKIK